MNDRQIRYLFRNLTNPSGRQILRRYQSQLLKRQLLYAAKNSPFYRSKFADGGIHPSVVQSIDDLPRLGFFTYPSDLQTDPFRFLAVPRGQILYAMSSSGTTGDPKVVFFTRQDWETATRLVANGMAMMGFRPDDVAQILFCSGNTAWMTGTLVQSALERLGAFVLPTGNSTNISKQIETIKRFGTTILLGTPSYLHRLTEEGSAITDLKSLGVRIIRLGAEPWSESLRAYLHQAWGAEIFDAYGMMELGAAGAGECKAKCGLHLSPYLITEVVDPLSGQPVPAGEFGELVFTPLVRQGSPLLRYRSGDLGRLLPEGICPCGEIPTDRLDRIAGRVDDMFFLGSGENVFPAHFEKALLPVPGLTSFQVIIEKVGYQDKLRLRVEAAAALNSSEQENLGQEILRSLYLGIPFLQHEVYQSQTLTLPVVEFVRPGALLEESPVKLRRIVDLRDGKNIRI